MEDKGKVWGSDYYGFSCPEHGQEYVMVAVQGCQYLELAHDYNNELFWSEAGFYGNDAGPHRVFCNMCGTQLGFLETVEW